MFGSLRLPGRRRRGQHHTDVTSVQLAPGFFVRRPVLRRHQVSHSHHDKGRLGGRQLRLPLPGRKRCLLESGLEGLHTGRVQR